MPWILLASMALAADVETWQGSVVLLQTGSSLCAGALVDERGTVATAYHCVASGRRPRVRTRDGEEVEGRLVATAPEHDLALVEAPELAGRPWLSLRAEPAMPGEEVWALGHPFGSHAESSRAMEGVLLWSVSRGVVSAVGPGLVQVDAALNPGNSGGPVVDSEGRVLGIASRKLRADNVAFIVPAARVQELMERPEMGRLTGGQLALGVGLWLPTLQGPFSSVGLDGKASLRDTVLLQAGVYLPVGTRWQAVQRGQVNWISAEANLGLRARVGRGRYSTTLDLYAGGVLRNGEVASIEDDHLRLLPVFYAPEPSVSARLATGGSAVRVGWLPLDRTLLIGVEVEFPGVIKAF